MNATDLAAVWEHLAKFQEIFNLYVKTMAKIEDDQHKSLVGLVNLVGGVQNNMRLLIDHTRDLYRRVEELENKPAIRKTPLN